VSTEQEDREQEELERKRREELMEELARRFDSRSPERWVWLALSDAVPALCVVHGDRPGVSTAMRLLGESGQNPDTAAAIIRDSDQFTPEAKKALETLLELLGL
jgi:hypothetical protein